MWAWIWVALIVVVLLIAFKFKEIRHKTGLVIIALVLIFLVFSFTQVYKANNVDLSSADGVTKVVKVYFVWLGGIFGNLGKVTSFAIHQDWGMNATNSSVGK